MKLFISLATLIVMSSSLHAQRTMVDVTGLADGSYVLTIAGSAVTVVPVRILTPGGGPVPPPQPPTTGVQSQVRAIVSAMADADTAEAMSIRWAAVATLAQQGVLTSTEQMATGIGKSLDAVLATLPGAKKSEWTVVVDKILAVVSDAEDEIIAKTGRAATVKEMAVVFEDVGKGHLPVGQSPAINWLELIKVIIEILKMLGIFPGAPAVGMTDSSTSLVASFPNTTLYGIRGNKWKREWTIR